MAENIDFFEVLIYDWRKILRLFAHLTNIFKMGGFFSTTYLVKKNRDVRG